MALGHPECRSDLEAMHALEGVGFFPLQSQSRWVKLVEAISQGDRDAILSRPEEVNKLLDIDSGWHNC